MWNYVHTDELCHHGIKGMKWGVRRYQNDDGSLTAAGKRRAAKDKYRKTEDDAFIRYEKTIQSIEKNYKRGQLLSEKDSNREIAADERYRKESAKAKAEYKKAVQQYKNDTALNKHQKNVRLGMTAAAFVLTTPVGAAAVAYGSTKYMRSKNDIERQRKGKAKVNEIIRNM